MPWWIFGNRANFFAAGGVDRRRAANFFIKCRGYEEIISGRESDQIVDLPRSISFTKSEHRTSIRLQAPGAT
jgi:hypothetical protein